jgi:hypothetical protein
VKICTQCGTEYPDELTVCAKDGGVLRAVPDATAASAMSRPAAEQLAPTGMMRAVRLPPADSGAPPAPKRRAPGLAFALLVLVPILAALAFLVLRPRSANEPAAATPAAADSVR